MTTLKDPKDPFKCPFCHSNYFGPIFEKEKHVGRSCKGWPSGDDRSYRGCRDKYEERFAPERTFNQAIATGQAWVDRDPIKVLKELQAAIGWNDGNYVIVLGKTDSYLFKRLEECIAFHTGNDTYIKNRKHERP